MDYKKVSEFGEQIAQVLDTHDKRSMFVKLCLPTAMRGRVNLEGPPNKACANLIEECLKYGCQNHLNAGYARLTGEDIGLDKLTF